MPQFPQSHLDHAKKRVTASCGDAVILDGKVRIVSYSAIRWSADPGESRIDYELAADGGGTETAAASSVTLHACDPNGRPAIGDAVVATQALHRRITRHGMPGVVTFSGRIRRGSAAPCDMSSVLFDDGYKSHLDANEAAYTLTGRATQADVEETLRRMTIWTRIAIAEDEHPKLRPDGFHLLTVPFARKDEIKPLGAIFSHKDKAWFAHPAARLERYDAIGIKHRAVPGDPLPPPYVDPFPEVRQ